VPRAIFTHVGSEIVKGDEHALKDQVQNLAEERGIEVQIAHDSMEEVLR
jgi:hypothetical protein